jgi:hypothetical protein
MSLYRCTYIVYLSISEVVGHSPLVGLFSCLEATYGLDKQGLVLMVNILSRDGVTIDGCWTATWIYCAL